MATSSLSSIQSRELALSQLVCKSISSTSIVRTVPRPDGFLSPHAWASTLSWSHAFPGIDPDPAGSPIDRTPGLDLLPDPSGVSYSDSAQRLDLFSGPAAATINSPRDAGLVGLSLVLVAHKELVYCRRVVLVSGSQSGRREIRFVRRIWKMLSLQAKCAASLVSLASLSLDAAIQRVARIELHSWLRRADLHHSACDRFVNPCRER